jgi:hypothetical protein
MKKLLGYRFFGFFFLYYFSWFKNMLYELIFFFERLDFFLDALKDLTFFFTKKSFFAISS